jgi:hypothetical protein
MSKEEVIQKFRDNMAFAGLGANADGVVNQIDRLESLRELRPLMTLCCAVTPA